MIGEMITELVFASHFKVNYIIQLLWN